MQACSTCKHSFLMNKPGNPEYRVCRRYPPTVHLIMMQQPPTVANPNAPSMQPAAQSVPAPVQGDWSCGEWRTILAAV